MTKSTFKNWHVDAYLEGRIDEIPAEALPFVKLAAEGREAVQEPKQPPMEMDTLAGEDEE